MWMCGNCASDGLGAWVMGSRCLPCPGLKPCPDLFIYVFSSTARCRFSHPVKGSGQIAHAELSLAPGKCMIKVAAGSEVELVHICHV